MDKNEFEEAQRLIRTGDTEAILAATKPARQRRAKAAAEAIRGKTRFEHRHAENMKDPDYAKAYEEAVRELEGAKYEECGCMVLPSGEAIFGPVGCPVPGHDD